MPTIVDSIAERITAVGSTAAHIADGNVYNHNLTALRVGSLEEALQQAGYQCISSLNMKRGRLEIFSRQNYAFAPFLPGEEERLADSGAAVYTKNENSYYSYFFMTAPQTPVNLEEIAKNAQRISSGIFESWPDRLMQWMAKDERDQNFKIILMISGGGLAGAALAIATGNGDTGTGALMTLGGALVGGASVLTATVASYLIASARVSNPCNYLFGKKATAALGADLAMLQKH